MADSRTGPSAHEARPPSRWCWRFRVQDQRKSANAKSAIPTPPAYDLAIGLQRVRELSCGVTLAFPTDEHLARGGAPPSELHEIAAGLLEFALDARASDLFIEPGDRATRVRIRRDRQLDDDVVELPTTLHAPLVDVLRMNLRGERQQSGIIQVFSKNKPVRFRASFIQSILGTHLTIRIPDPRGAAGLHRLGFFPDTLAALERIVSRPTGLFVVSGPAASGRTTTLYALLNRLNHRSNHVMTLEDSVELIIPGVTQIERDSLSGRWCDAVRECLRHAPDMLMVGDPGLDDVASLAEHADGCLLLCSASASSAVMVLARLSELGVPRHLLASNFAGVLNQRLVRRLCEACKQPVRDSRDLSLLLPQNVYYHADALLDQTVTYAPTGCEKCRNSGYQGQLGLYEVLEGTPAIKSALARGSNFDELEELGIREGVRPLLLDGLRKVAAGITSLDEVMQVLGVTASRTRTYAS